MACFFIKLNIRKFSKYKDDKGVIYKIPTLYFYSRPVIKRFFRKNGVSRMYHFQKDGDFIWLGVVAHKKFALWLLNHASKEFVCDSFASCLPWDNLNYYIRWSDSCLSEDDLKYSTSWSDYILWWKSLFPNDDF